MFINCFRTTNPSSGFDLDAILNMYRKTSDSKPTATASDSNVQQDEQPVHLRGAIYFRV
jgi:hypothetical protein